MPSTIYHSPETALVEPLKRFSRGNVEFEILIYTYPRLAVLEKNDFIKKIIKHILDNDCYEKHIDTFSKFERYLLALGKRDHFIHQFEVFLLGTSFIDILLTNHNHTLFGTCNEDIIYSTWALASSFHDFGYPLEIASELNADIGNLFKDFGLTRLSSLYDQIMPHPNLFEEHSLCNIIHTNKTSGNVSLCAHLHEILRQQLSEDLALSDDAAQKLQRELVYSKSKSGKHSPNHGYTSAILLANIFINDILIKDPKANLFSLINTSQEFKDIKRALGAICLHSIPPKHVRNISFDKNPYGYILYIIDNLQDWDRCVFPNDNYPVYSLSDFKKDRGKLQIVYSLASRAWTKPMLRKVVKDINEKRKLLQSLPAPKQKLQMQVDVCYKFSDVTGKTDETISLFL